MLTVETYQTDPSLYNYKLRALVENAEELIETLTG